MKEFCFLTLILIAHNIISQETLLLGEQKAEEVYFIPRTDNVKKISVYAYHYNKKNYHKDSALVKIEEYSANGMLLTKANISGKNGERWSQFNYDFNENSEMIAYQFNYNGPDGIYAKSGTFSYNTIGKLITQVHSLANIKYSYHKDGKMKTKSYYYLKGGEEISNTWTDYYIYDKKKNLVHVDQDSTSDKQTSFYNDKSELIRNDYYPGVAYSTFNYDDKGNCVEQIDYELNKTDWDSTIYTFNYNSNLLTTSLSSKKRGRITMDEERIYDKNGRLLKIFLYRKNKKKGMKKYFYEHY